MSPLRLAPLAAALLMAPAHSTIAAESDAGPRELDRVRVHGERVSYKAESSSLATRTDTLLRDTPQAVTVVTEPALDDQAINTVADVARYIPGIGVAQGEGNRDTLVFRGNSSTADMFVDGMRDDVQFIRDLYNIDRVEALKGPGAMTFGRGGTGGVLNRVTKTADWDTRREVSLQVGSFNRRRVTADIDQPMSDTASFRVTALHEDSESHRDGFELTRYGINPTFSWRAGDATLVTLGYERFHDERVADRGIPSFRGLPIDVPASRFFGDPDRSPVDATVDALTAYIEHDFGDGTMLRNRTRYAQYDKFYQNVFPGAVDAAGTQVNISAYSNTTERDNLFNQTDLILTRDWGATQHTWLVGAEVGRQVTDNYRTTGYFGPVGSTVTSVSVPLIDPIYRGPLNFRQSATDADNHATTRTAAAYVQDQVEFGPHWQAVLGVRYDRFRTELRNDRNGAVFHGDDETVSPRVGLIYKPIEPVSIYASYSEAFVPRAGEQLSSLSASNQALEPEQFANREIGAKWDVSPSLALSVAVYRLDRSNVAVVDPGDSTRLILLPGKAQRVQGGELGISGNVTDAWSITGGYAYQDGEILQTIRTSATAVTPAGRRLAQLPRHSASLWNRYDFSQRWGVGLGAVYRDGIFASLNNTVRLKPFVRYDAAVFFRASDTLRLQLNVENLFDKAYTATANSDNNLTPGSPRAFYVTASLDF